MYDFSGKTALVTGASKGIGEACARQLDACGARVALAARSVGDMEKIAQELANDPVVIDANLAKEDQTEACAAEALAKLGGVDILVNNAGLGWNEEPTEITAKRLDLQLGVNLRNLILLTTALSASLIERKGSVINISSVAAWGGGPLQAVYAATKGGVNSYTTNLGNALAERGVRVNAIAPGSFDTAILESFGPDARKHYEQASLLKRQGEPRELADAVLFLVSDASTYITGATLHVNGGSLLV